MSHNLVCTIYDTVNVYKNTCPANLSMPGDTIININATLYLDANSENCESNYPDYVYLWSPGETTETITLNASDLGLGNHEISVTLTNNSTSSNSQTSDVVMVNVSNADAIITFDSNSIRIYPNPSKGMVKIYSERIVKNGFIELVNLTGQIIYFENFESILGYKELDFSDFNDGVYFININFEGKTIKRKVILN
ncbi:MAG: T9SS type A sorting domain-containing protein [Bacteroidales bacterium]|nr:T9SS type A sorting domain-containing protein [Bacteroidales bacterium]